MICDRRAISALLLAAAGCATGAGDRTNPSRAADEAAVRAAYEQYLRGMLPPGDVEGMLAPFADSAQYLAAGEPSFRGKPAIRQFFQGYVDAYALGPTTYAIHDVRVAGDLAVVVGAATEEFTDRKTGATFKEVFKGLGALQRQADGTWKFLYYMYNSDRAAPERLVPAGTQ